MPDFAERIHRSEFLQIRPEALDEMIHIDPLEPCSSIVLCFRGGFAGWECKEGGEGDWEWCWGQGRVTVCFALGFERL